MEKLSDEEIAMLIEILEATKDCTAELLALVKLNEALTKLIGIHEHTIVFHNRAVAVLQELRAEKARRAGK